MRLWHSKLIPLLDGKRLCDLHMSCCNLRGNGWGKRNAAVGYLYEDPLGEDALAAYHHHVLAEMSKRGYSFSESWWEVGYCGKNRPTRDYNPVRYIEAYGRNIPLKGHGLQIFKNDVETLQSRGVPIEVTHIADYDYDGEPYVVYTVCKDDIKIQYGIKLMGGTKDEH